MDPSHPVSANRDFGCQQRVVAPVINEFINRSTLLETPLHFSRHRESLVILWRQAEGVAKQGESLRGLVRSICYSPRAKRAGCCAQCCPSSFVINRGLEDIPLTPCCDWLPGRDPSRRFTWTRVGLIFLSAAVPLNFFRVQNLMAASPSGSPSVVTARL
jgi:hypothetical protein